MLDDLAAGQIGFGTVWLLGVSMGLTACTVTCLPFMGTWALGRASGTAEAFRHALVFLAGRVLTYTALAASAGLAGLGLAKALGGTWGNALIGGASIAAGLWLLVRARRPGCAPKAPAVQPLRFRGKADAAPPFALGAALALTPCTPLASLLALAAQSGSALNGAGYGLAFGLGAAMTPILILVPLAGRLGRELRCGRPWLSRWLVWVAAAVLILLGLRRLLA
ncbi:sulfite exporter TauE/SafE family protein [Azonexus sp.]|uniref:urease accessory protein UreH domain-containing protein n=1 Tax=Azonexus sp. TaxID=1872668 RepID=UPI0035B35A9A